MPRSHQIQIRLEHIPHGPQIIVVVEPNPCYIGPGDEVVWSCEDGYPFAIHFDPLSPVEHRRASAPGGAMIGEQVRGKILPGKYRYLVAVFDGNRIHTEDPELIDENN